KTEKTELLNETMFRNLAHAKVMTAAQADDDNSVRISGGTVQIEGVRIGDTPITEYDEIETELQTAPPASDVLDLSPMQIFEEGVGAELVRDWPLDDAGNRTDAPPSTRRSVASPATMRRACASSSTGRAGSSRTTAMAS
ncbi:hypothetical protein AL036_22490, partial [Salipiger aestuarii]|uniref:hypothetical protein n=1 Tax=Salipiger aestuarii TaxID=568098 RepID=UPI001CC2A64C